MSSTAKAHTRLERLLGFLGRDPDNAALLADTAQAAFDEKAYDVAQELIGRCVPLSPSLTNLAGMVALAQQRYGDAAAIFEGLRTQGGDDPVLRFNLAWSRAMMDDFQGALDLLDDAAVAASPRAPSLKIQAMHHLELYDEGLEAGAALAQTYPGNRELMGALATLAMDAEKIDLAQHYGERAGDNAEGRAAMGMLALGDHDPAKSLALFDLALQQQPGNPRAWLGKGLGQMAAGDPAAGVLAIDRGAELFGDHIGSWVASGWAHFVNRDYAGARESFERAMAIDPNFGETHGGLAVLDVVEGKTSEAKKRCETAIRLDKNSFGAALAKSLLLEQSGHPDVARKVIEKAMTAPVGPRGETLGQALMAMGRIPHR